MTLSAAASPRPVPLYGVDTMLFVYHFEDHPQFGPRVIVAGAEAFVTEDRRLANISAIRVIGLEQAVN